MSQLGKRAWSTWAIVLVFLIGGTVYTLLEVDFSVVRSLGILTMCLLLLTAVAYTWEAALGTYTTFRSLGYRPSFVRLYMASCASLSSSYLMPAKAGMPVWLILCKAFLGIPLVASTAQTLIETALGMGVNVSLSLIGVVALFTGYNPYIFAGVAVALGVILTVALAFDWQIALSSLDDSPAGVQTWTRRVLSFIVELQRQIRQASKRWLLASVGLFLVRLAVRMICLHIVFSSLGAGIPMLSILYAQSISGVLGWISMLPMGAGVKDVTLIGLLTATGISSEAAVLGGIVDRVLWSVVPIVLGAVSASILGVRDAIQTGSLQVTERDFPARQ